jgi:hypothetical protein
MQEDAINVFCLLHGLSFLVSGSNRVVICKENHVLSYNFPHSGRWFYCCLCQKYWVAPKGEGWQDDFSKQCPSCNLIKKARYYSCDQCNVTMIDSLGAINRKGVHITPWGTPHPHCPGCHQLPKSVPQSHACPELNGLLTTARAECPFCEGKDMAQGVIDVGESRIESEAPRVGSADELGASDPSQFAREELERRASEIRAFEAEAEAREVKAQERLRQVEARLRQELLRRSEVERKSSEIEEELRRQQEIDQSRMELVRTASEAAARSEEERKTRIAAEQSKAEAETKLREFEAKVSEVEERFRQAEAGLQQETLKRSLAEERANELGNRFAAESAKIKAEAEAKIQGIGVEARRIEENYKAEIDWIRAELERVTTSAKQAEENHRAENDWIRAELEGVTASAKQAEENHRAEIDWIRAELEGVTASAKQAEENHRAEIARIKTEAEARTQQVEANTRQQYQIKVEEAIANTQAAMFNLEETQKKLDETEAGRHEMEARARKAEILSRRLYLISKLSFTSAEQIIVETPGSSDEFEKDAVVVPLDLTTNTYTDDFSSETPEPGANGSLDYEDYQFSDRMRALFKAASRVNAIDDKGGRVGSEE